MNGRYTLYAEKPKIRSEKMGIIDLLSWKIVQGMFFLQFIIFSFLLKYVDNIEMKAECMGHAMSGNIVSHSNPDQLPQFMVVQLMMWGRFTLIMVSAGIITKVLRTVLL